MVISAFGRDAVLDLIAAQRVTHVFAVPTMLLMMSARHAHTRQDLSHVRTVAFGASAMPPEKLAEVQRMFPRAGLVHGMGQTESCGTIVTLPSSFAFEKAGSVGVHIGGMQVRIVDESDREVAAGVVGELVARGSNVMSHYHENPEATSEALAGGWLHTGDLGYLDEDGFLFLVDRKKDLIIRGGENIYSSEVENVLYMLETVEQAAVVPARSELFGEEVYAFVVPRPGAVIDEASVREHCSRHLADYKVPVGIRVVEAMPQTATGKVQKHRLRQWLPDGMR
jgi:acyl-CoA synthetase (AMP-forming)/AMP-acid ligase II